MYNVNNNKKKSWDIHVKQNHDWMCCIKPITFMFKDVLKILSGDNVKSTKLNLLWIKSQCFQRTGVTAVKMLKPVQVKRQREVDRFFFFFSRWNLCSSNILRLCTTLTNCSGCATHWKQHAMWCPAVLLLPVGSTSSSARCAPRDPRRSRGCPWPGDVPPRWQSSRPINQSAPKCLCFQLESANAQFVSVPLCHETQGGPGSLSALPSLAVLQEEILWFWPWNPVLHQRELGVAAAGRGIDISSFTPHDEMLWNAAGPVASARLKAH